MSDIVVSSGTTSGTSIGAGSVMTVLDTGIAEHILVTSGGVISAYNGGKVISVSISSGGTEIISSSGVGSATHVNVHGTEIIRGGVERNGWVFIGGDLYVSAGGLTEALHVNRAGHVFVGMGGISDGTVSVEGLETVYAGGMLLDSKVSGGLQSVIGGSTTGTFLYARGSTDGYSTQIVTSGGTASATHIDASAQQDVGALTGSATGTSIAYKTVDRGLENLYPGGETSGTKVLSGGLETIYSGTESFATKVSSGGSETVDYGVASSTMVYRGGYAAVYAGGEVKNTTIEGGELEIGAGAIAIGKITFKDTTGRLVIDSTTMPAARISGFAAGDSIVLSGISYSAGDGVSVNAANIVTVSAGGDTYNLKIAGATVGETDFVFGPGSILTKSGASAMVFLPPVGSSAGIDDNAGVTPSAMAMTADDFAPEIARGFAAGVSTRQFGGLHIEEARPVSMLVPVSMTQGF